MQGIEHNDPISGLFSVYDSLGVELKNWGTYHSSQLALLGLGLWELESLKQLRTVNAVSLNSFVQTAIWNATQIHKNFQSQKFKKELCKLLASVDQMR